MSSAPRPRPKYYDLSPAHLPPPGLVSIFHRVSGLLLFFPVLPLLLSLMEGVLGTEQGYAQWQALFARPGVKLVLLVMVWLYAHHFWAGVRFLLLDLHWGIAKAPSRATAYAVLALGVATTLLVGWRLW